MKKALSILLAVIMVLSMFAACGKTPAANDPVADQPQVDNTEAPAEDKPAEDADPIKLRIILQAADDVRIGIMNDYIVPNFDAAFPGYELEISTITGSVEDVAMMKTYNATGDLPDVYWSDARWAVPMINSGSQLDLTEAITADGFIENWSDPSLMDFKGGKYALQPGSDARYFSVIFYNTEIFEKYDLKVPTTMDELYAVCDTLVANGVQPFQIDGTGHYMSAAWIQALLCANDPSTVQKLLNNETDWSDPAILAVYEQLEEMYQKGYFGDRQAASASTPAETRERFAAGESAMQFDFYWQYSVYDNGHTGAFLMPSNNSEYPAGSVLMNYSGSLTGYAVNANSENLDAAIKLAEFCCEQEAKYHNEHGTATVFNTGIAIEPTCDLQALLNDMFEATNLKLNPYYLNTMDSAVSAEFKTLNSAFIAGQYTPAEVLEEINAIFAENTYFE